MASHLPIKSIKNPNCYWLSFENLEYKLTILKENLVYVLIKIYCIKILKTWLCWSDKKHWHKVIKAVFLLYLIKKKNSSQLYVILKTKVNLKRKNSYLLLRKILLKKKCHKYLWVRIISFAIDKNLHKKKKNRDEIVI